MALLARTGYIVLGYQLDTSLVNMTEEWIYGVVSVVRKTEGGDQTKAPKVYVYSL